MKGYKEKITLVKNSRGCYILDTIKGCGVCKVKKPHGCYGDCYAKNISARYGFDFSIPILRQFQKDTAQLYLAGFHDTKHETEILRAIEKIDMPFVRIGEMGDPSGDWGHTLEICKIISQAKKPIVIITKHWEILTGQQLVDMGKLNICVNTSISALDDWEELDHRLIQYERLGNYCNSVLRIVSCDFNKDTPQGKDQAKIQDLLFQNPKVIDTIFRPSKSNPLVVNKVVNVKKVKFLKSEMLASVFNKNTYFGDCANCPDMCGINL